MNASRSSLFLFSLGFFILTLSGCFFYSGVSKIDLQTHASGSGFMTAAERNGQWEADGPPPRVGEVTDRLCYRKLLHSSALSIIGSATEYELSEPYPYRQRRIVAIREVGTSNVAGRTVHYYEVEFDPVTER